MRLPTGFRWLYPLTLAVAVIASPLLSAGCGGGSSSSPGGGSISTPTPGTPTPTPTPTPSAPVNVKTTIIWANRVSRQQTNGVTSVASAVSAVVSLTNANQNPSTALTQTVNRTADVDTGGSKTYLSTSKVTPGAYALDVKFYSDYDGKGTLVGTAGASASVGSDGNLNATVAAVAKIQKVTIPAEQSITIDQTKRLSNVPGDDVILYEPRDEKNNIVALDTSNNTSTPATLKLVSDTSTVPPSPAVTAQSTSITGKAPGSAVITASIDGAVSASATITVRSKVTLDVTPKNPTVSIESQIPFKVDIKNDNAGTGAKGVTWSVAEGASAGSIDANGVFTSLQREGTFTVVATSNYDPLVSVRVPVIVTSQVAVSVLPTPIPKVSFKGGTLQLTAKVSNVPDGKDDGVTWQVTSANSGSINDAGLFTSNPTRAESYNATVVATSKYDTRKKATVTIPVGSAITGITVTAPGAPGDGTEANPYRLPIKAQREFKGKLDNLPAGQDAGIKWTIISGGGSITADGGLYSAPDTAQDQVKIRATSNYDPAFPATIFFVKVESGSAGITVN
jgi:hypothetical protein